AIRLGFNWKIAMVERLVGDPRMQRVWSELSEQKRDRDYRRTDCFEHQATPPTPFARSGLTNGAIQQKAIRELFWATANAAQCFELLPERWSNRAAELRADAARLEVGQPRKKCSALATKLIAAAEAYEQADRIVPSLSHVRLVKAVTEIADLMEERFG